MEIWILTFALCAAMCAATLCVLSWIKATQKPSRGSSSADNVWRTEVDTQIAELQSRVELFSAALKRIEGRQSARARKETETPAATDKDAWRRRVGIVPPVKQDAD